MDVGGEQWLLCKVFAEKREGWGGGGVNLKRVPMVFE